MTSVFHGRGAASFLVGLTIILVCELLLFLDIHRSHRGVIHSDADAAVAASKEPGDFLGRLTQQVAINMTPLAWLGFVILLDGILTAQTGIGPIRSRPHHFATCALASIIVWSCFDIINFYCFKPPAWTYVGVPLTWPQRYFGYISAFAAELPAMFMLAQVIMNLHWFDRAKSEPRSFPRWIPPLISLTGGAMLAWPILSGDAKANYTLWTSLVLLLDPINLKLNRPSILGDWQNGRYARTLSLFAAGLFCGFLWEFWNYWALAKWVYHLPFLGSGQKFHYFEMPLPGLLGFIPFAMECWVVWQTLRIPLDKMVEPLTSDGALI